METRFIGSNPESGRSFGQHTGNVPLTEVVLDDDIEGAIECPETELAVGESMTCTLETVAVEDAYVNTGTVTGTPPPTQTPDGPVAVPPVTDDDPANYFGWVDQLPPPPTPELPRTGGSPQPLILLAYGLLVVGFILNRRATARNRRPSAT